jgi:hypothetical protein
LPHGGNAAAVGDGRARLHGHRGLDPAARQLRRGGVEALLSVAAALAGLGQDELSVRLDSIHHTLGAEVGIIDDPMLLGRLEPLVSLARTRLAPERVAALGADAGAPTLEHALELLDSGRSARG